MKILKGLLNARVWKALWQLLKVVVYSTEDGKLTDQERSDMYKAAWAVYRAVKGLPTDAD